MTRRKLEPAEEASFVVALRRALAIVLIFALVALPRLGVAAPIEEPPSAETLVEGHVVFATIDAYQASGPSVAAASARAGSGDVGSVPAGAAAAGGLYGQRIEREAGVLWFNDQYLLPPRVETEEALGGNDTMTSRFGAALAVLVRGDDGHGIREPCGGAVMAVNAGDPDPRGFAFVEIDGRDALFGGRAQGGIVSIDSQEPAAGSDGLVTATSSGLVGDVGVLPVDYVESYRLADPNDRVWVVDKYVGVGNIATSGDLTMPYAYPIWVVNLFGGEVFVPDAGEVLSSRLMDDCEAASDLAGPAQREVSSQSCGLDVPAVLPTLEDEPCMSYAEPSRGGYCYSGRFVDFEAGCDRERHAPPRRYHALLHFRWEDLTIARTPADHSDPYVSLATNGCESGTEWPCPGEAPWEVTWGYDSDAEGDSHGFHPVVPPHVELEPCPVPAPNPTNHGGSTAGAAGLCDYVHAAAAVEVYYSGRSRPPAPAARYYAIDDLAGSSAGFHDFLSAYPEAS